MKKIFLLAALVAALTVAVKVYWPRKTEPLACGPSAELLIDGSRDVRIVFGYKDARPARFVGDRYERIVLVQELLKPCSASRFDCGFERSAKDGELFTKELRGPDGARRNIELRVLGSAAGPDDAENRADPFQRWKSARAERTFLHGLAGASAVFYDGHSRDGGGPDFYPPRLRSDSHVDYLWYRGKKRGVSAMEQAIGVAKRPARVVGLFSCDSNNLAVGGAALHRQVRWITYNKLYYFADAMRDLRKSLSEVLRGKCK